MAKASALSKAYRSLRKAKKAKKLAAKKGSRLAGAAKAGLNAAAGSILGMLGKGAGEANAAPADFIERANEAASNLEGAKTEQKATYPVAEVLTGVLIPRDDIIPKLGPEEGEYATHLNLIISRIAALESEVLRQNKLLSKVYGIVNEQLDVDRQNELKREREADEQGEERATMTQKIVDSAKGMAQAYGGTIAARLLPVAAAAGYFAGGELIGLLEDNDTPMEDVFGAVEAIEETAIKATVAAGAAKGTGAATLARQMADTAKSKASGAVKQGAQAVKSTKVGTAITTTATNVREAGAKAGQKARDVARGAQQAAQTGAAAVKRDVAKVGQKAADATRAAADAVKGAAPKPAALPASMIEAPKATATPTGGAAAQAKSVLPASVSNSAFYKKVLQNMNKAKATVEALAKKAQELGTKAMDFVKNLPKAIQKLLKTAGKSIVKWALIIEAIMFMIRSTELLLLGGITEQEWHKGNKEQINKILALFGAPWVITKIGFLVGSVIPVLGNAAGALAGLIIGIIWGDKLYYALGVDKLVDALYDFIVLGSTDGFKTLWSDLKNYVTQEIPRMIAETAKETVSYITGVDVAASEEELAEKYGEEASTVDILRKAGEGIGTDEDAILGALKRVKTEQDWAQLNQDFKIMRESMGENQTLDEYLQDELSRGEYDQAMDQVDQQLGRPQKVRVLVRRQGSQRLTREEIKDALKRGDITRRQADQAFEKFEERPTETQSQMSELTVGGVVVERDGQKVALTESDRKRAQAAIDVQTAMAPDAEVYDLSTNPVAPSDPKVNVIVDASSPAPQKRGREISPMASQPPATLSTSSGRTGRDSFTAANPNYS